MLQVEVCYAEPHRAWRVAVTLPVGATVADAIARSRIDIPIAPADLAIFGRRATLDTPLADGDRVELLRPLVVEPMEARRRRAAKKRATPDDPPTCSTAPPGPAAC